jgi:hypothetical protein
MRITCVKSLAAAALVVIYAVLAVSLLGQAITNDTVLVHVRVMNSKKELVPGLTSENFQIREDGVQQKISFFSAADDPSDVRFILLTPGPPPSRVSDTVANEIEAAYIAFKKAGNPANKYAFEGLPDGYDGNRNLLTTIDSILDELKRSLIPRRVLIVVTGNIDDAFGSFNGQGITIEHNQFKDSNIPVYLLFLNLSRANSGSGPPDVLARSPIQYATLTKGSVLIEMASKTRGGYYSVSPAKLESQLLQLATDMKAEYVLGFKSTNGANDNTWRKLKIDATAEGRNLTASFKDKYFVQKQ